MDKKKKHYIYWWARSKFFCKQKKTILRVFTMYNLNMCMYMFCIFFPQGSQTSNQYIRQLHINHFIGREKKHKRNKKEKKMCAVRRTQSAKMSGWHFSYWGIRDKIRSVQSTLTGQKLTKWKWTAASQFAEVETLQLRPYHKDLYIQSTIRSQRDILCSFWHTLWQSEVTRLVKSDVRTAFSRKAFSNVKYQS